MVNESRYADDPFEETHEYREDEYIASDRLPWWARKAPPLLVSGLLHAVLILICAYLITSYISTEKKAAVLNFFTEPKKEQYNHEAERDIFKNREIIAEIMVEDPVIIHDEEKELTKKIPRGKSPDNLTNINLNGDSISAVFGVGGTPAGACGVPWGKGSLKREGGSKETERVVDAALRWLHFHQDKPEGRWDIDDYQRNCKGPGAPCSHMNGGQAPASGFDSGVSGLALLAFLGYGQTHRVGRFKRTVRRGLKFLLSCQDPDTGRFGDAKGESWIYNQALATMAICEAYAVTRDNILKKPAQKAINYIISSQNPGYGWKYEPRDRKNDTSVTGWMVLALKAAKMGKLAVSDSAFKGAIEWFDHVTRVSDGKVGYMRPGDPGAKLAGRPADTFKSLPTMTAVSVLCRIFCGQKRTNKKIQQGVKILMDNLPDYNKPKNDKVNYYYWYYATYAMFQVGGPKWKAWNDAMKKALIKTQRAGRICQDGSWDPIGEWCVVGGRVYATAINALTLEIYYRYARVQRAKNRGF
ncbi:MAG: hypothetical protein E3J72_03310 [Planctomycetota bacterium]|nr:MAG: hypothetical protein E3J72_03310 [Planctomycetota bacterium]